MDLSGSGTLRNISKYFCFTPRLVLRSDAIVTKDMASVAKWLRQWFVVPPFVGSIPIIRPFNSELFNSIARRLYGNLRWW